MAVCRSSVLKSRGTSPERSEFIIVVVVVRRRRRYCCYYYFYYYGRPME